MAALEPTGVPWHKRFAGVNLAIPEPLSAAPPRSPKAATGATPPYFKSKSIFSVCLPSLTMMSTPLEPG